MRNIHLPAFARKRIHPSLYFEDGFAAVGIVDPTGKPWLVTSDRKQYPSDKLWKKGVLAVRPLGYPGLANRWEPGDLSRFLNGDLAPSFASLVGRTAEAIHHHVELQQPAEVVALTCWIIGTYFFPLFPAFPRLNLHGERGSGKSKLLQVISSLAFNGLLRLNPTPAVLFRLIRPLRPTLCLDEVEGLARDDRRDLMAIINSGYKAGGAVDRVEGEDRHIETFEVYSPSALASIAGLNPVTEDRTITLIMEPGKDAKRLNKEVNSADPLLTMIRAWCYRIALVRYMDVLRAWQTLVTPSWLVARHRELYGPLLTIASLADAERSLGATEDLLALARQQTSERGGISFEGEALLRLLEQLLGGSGDQTVRPGDLALPLYVELGYRPSPERVGQLLRRFAFPRRRVKHGTEYEITRVRLNDIAARYTP